MRRILHLALHDGDGLAAFAPSYLKTNSHGEFVFDWSWASAYERYGQRYRQTLGNRGHRQRNAQQGRVRQRVAEISHASPYHHAAQRPGDQRQRIVAKGGDVPENQGAGRARGDASFNPHFSPQTYCEPPWSSISRRARYAPWGEDRAISAGEAQA